MMWIYLSLMALLAMAASEKIASPCPGLFEYDEEREPGHWEGTLTLLTDYKLHGIWARVFFDKPVKKMELLDHRSGEIMGNDNSKEFLIKNREMVLKKNEPLKVRFTVSYEGSSAPALIGYRLNARDVCPQGLD